MLPRPPFAGFQSSRLFYFIIYLLNVVELQTVLIDGIRKLVAVHIHDAYCSFRHDLLHDVRSFPVRSEFTSSVNVARLQLLQYQISCLQLVLQRSDALVVGSCHSLLVHL